MGTKNEDKMICPSCGKELHTEHDLYYDMRMQKMGCVYCMGGRIKEHVEWCDRWRKENVGHEVEEVEEPEQELREEKF